MTNIKQPDWDNAPEDATHWECFGRNGFWIKDWDVATGEHMFLNTTGRWMLGTYASNRTALTKRPAKSPVYTQAMCDAGELPLIGMECKLIYCSANYIGTIKYISTSCVVVKQTGRNYERAISIKGLKFRPIDTRTDKEKAVNSVYNGNLSVRDNLANAYDKWVK
tara:strand:+ start:172 stop:666 length:495 start_codon:yes stop_codon:yes gene_type:complete